MMDIINAAPALVESANTLAAQAQSQVVETSIGAGVPGTIGSRLR